MPFLDHDVRDARLVILFQFDAGVSDRQELIVKDLEGQGHTVRGPAGTQRPPWAGGSEGSSPGGAAPREHRRGRR